MYGTKFSVIIVELYSVVYLTMILVFLSFDVRMLSPLVGASMTSLVLCDTSVRQVGHSLQGIDQGVSLRLDRRHAFHSQDDLQEVDQ